MTKSTITFRTDETRKTELDLLAKSLNRDRSFIINEAIDNHLTMYDWQIRHIKQGLQQADSGDFVSHDDVMKKMDKMITQCK